MSAQNYLPDVKEQYEGYPYPERNPEDEKSRLLFTFLGRMDAVNHHCFQGRQNFENFRVLVAGGGTGDTTIWWAEQLRDRKGSSVTYIDLSTASAEICKNRAKIRNLDNITWINDSLLNVGGHGLAPFDFIDCGGVLHHLADPDAGLAALKSVLKPEGAMHVMVYAPYGRAGIYQMQALMKMVNANAENDAQKVANAKAVLATVPATNVYSLMSHVTKEFADLRNDAGIYDLFLHSQDRAYTIDQVHDWLERAGMKMAAEPGSRYGQEDYLPETWIKDPQLLARIQKLPLKTRQAIGEGMSGRIAKHEFFTVHANRGDTEARCTDLDLIPWIGMNAHFTLQQLAEATKGQPARFYAEVPGMPNTRVFMPVVKHGVDILSRIDGMKSIREIVESIPGDRAEIMRDFQAVFTDLNRGQVLFLRHPTVAPFPTAAELHLRSVKP